MRRPSHGGRGARLKARVVTFDLVQPHRHGPYAAVLFSFGSGCAGYDGPLFAEADSQQAAGVDSVVQEKVARRVGPLLSKPPVILAWALPVRMTFHPQRPARMIVQPVHPLVNQRLLVPVDRGAVELEEYPVSFAKIPGLDGGRTYPGGGCFRRDHRFRGGRSAFLGRHVRIFRDRRCQIGRTRFIRGGFRLGRGTINLWGFIRVEKLHDDNDVDIRCRGPFRLRGRVGVATARQ